MRKHFVLSTRTLVSKRNVTQSFGSDNTIYVPLAVMEEIEHKYSDQISERGKIARETLEYLGSFHYKDLEKGVVQKNGSILVVPTNFYEEELDKSVERSELNKLDRRILQTCCGIKKQVPKDEPVILVSKKPSLRKKAEMLGLIKHRPLEMNFFLKFLNSILDVKSLRSVMTRLRNSEKTRRFESTK